MNAYVARSVNFVGHARLVGHMVDIRITEANPNSLRGEVVLGEAALGEVALAAV